MTIFSQPLFSCLLLQITISVTDKWMDVQIVDLHSYDGHERRPDVCLLSQQPLVKVSQNRDIDIKGISVAAELQVKVSYEFRHCDTLVRLQPESR